MAVSSKGPKAEEEQQRCDSENVGSIPTQPSNLILCIHQIQQ